ncbi:MAG: hypothetical protein OXF68_02550 [Gammaproteobacteria bacterium]|nr:hypothetical protein [Gammaproteobacteria bacterium]
MDRDEIEAFSDAGFAAMRLESEADARRALAAPPEGAWGRALAAAVAERFELGAAEGVQGIPKDAAEPDRRARPAPRRQPGPGR